MRSSGLVVAALLLLQCGTDVDLGGSVDAATLDAAPLGQECAPCTSSSECASNTCAQYAGDLFCASVCTATAPCAADHTCATVTTTAGTSTQACVPSSGACAPAAPPSGPDGAVLDTCGALNGPTVVSQCKACGKYSNDCQANGCYGGYWCNEPARDCQPPPKTCP